MSTTAAVHPPRSSAGQPGGRLHHALILLGALAAIAVIAALAVNGYHYYGLSPTARVLSPQNAELKPSGRIGHALGMIGFGMFVLMFLYPLRKHWGWLARKGKTKHWLDYHILMGLTAPVLVTFHSAFKLNGIAGVAYWIMVSVAVSGIVGRYFYGAIPRRLDHAEMSMDEMEQLRQSLAQQLESQQILSAQELAPLLALPRLEEVQAMPLLKALLVVMALDLRRAWLLWRLRHRAHVAAGALAVVKQQMALTKSILFFSKMRQLFDLWHIIHRPFSYSFAVLILLHIAAVMILGYF